MKSLMKFYEALKNKIPNWLLETAIIFFITLALLAVSYLIFEKIYENKIYPNVYLGDINLGEKTKDEALSLINNKTDNIKQAGINFYLKNQTAKIFPLISSPEGDIVYEIIYFDQEKTAAEAVNYGRDDNFFISLKNKIGLLIFGKKIGMHFVVNEKEVGRSLADNFSKFITAPADASLAVVNSNNSDKNNIFFEIKEERYGQTIDYQKGINELIENLGNLKNNSIYLIYKDTAPLIFKENCGNIAAEAEIITNLAPIKFILPNSSSSPLVSNNEKIQQWVIPKEVFANLLKIKILEKEKNKIHVGLDEDKLKTYFEKNITPQINISPAQAKFTIKNGRITEFQKNKDGREINIDETIKIAEEKIIVAKNNTVELILKEVKSSIQSDNVNEFGITEIVGTGKSTFSGSPKNRRHNINVGANSLNGILIKPGEEFSLLKALGKVDAKSGYLQELVIKENKTTPEFGGGLCQIGTTMFRAALSTGLPITVRRNHSYRVQYYEPAGTDATIYDPWPDFRFLNDMPTYILIQSRIEGDNLYFDFWGAADGRLATQTKPVIYNIVKPKPTKIIETLNLKPGEKKCTEKSHNGADAYFDYTVTYNNSEVRKKRFSSHYVPWQAVCLVGVEKLSSSTPATLENVQPGTTTMQNNSATSSQ